MNGSLRMSISRVSRALIFSPALLCIRQGQSDGDAFVRQGIPLTKASSPTRTTWSEPRRKVPTEPAASRSASAFDSMSTRERKSAHACPTWSEHEKSRRGRRVLLEAL